MMGIASLLHKTGLVGLLFLSLLFSSCDIRKNNQETDPKNTFIKIYENQDFSESIIPIDVKQTSDGGFLHLAKRRILESSFYGIYVMKTNVLGDFVSEQMVATDYVNPVYSLMKSGNLYFFFCMDRLTLETKLMSVNDNGEVAEVASIPGVIYPLYASQEESVGQFILQHYNRDEKRTVVSRINTSGTITAQREFNIGFGEFDAEEPIIDHLTGIGKPLPFLTGTVGSGTYFFNGFYSFNLSTVFFSFGTSAPGLLQGYKDERSISSAKHISGNTFAVSRYAFGENYFIPNATLNVSSGAIASSSDLVGNRMLELSEDANVILKSVSIHGKKILIYNSDTKSKQIGLFFYDENNGSLLGTRYYGYSNPYEVGNFITTDDGGLAIVGTTYLAGRFARIVLIKISKEELENIVN
jgi:hypothetical protein